MRLGRGAGTRSTAPAFKTGQEAQLKLTDVALTRGRHGGLAMLSIRTDHRRTAIRSGEAEPAAPRAIGYQIIASLRYWLGVVPAAPAAHLTAGEKSSRFEMVTPPGWLATVDEWRRKPDCPSRAGAIRRLVQLALQVYGKR